MPTLIREVSEIFAQRQSDTLFVRFKASKKQCRGRHLFCGLKARVISCELACPDGHLEGYTDFCAIHVPDLTDTLYLKFLDEFETAAGRSKRPDSCELMTTKLASWRSAKAKEEGD